MRSSAAILTKLTSAPPTRNFAMVATEADAVAPATVEAPSALVVDEARADADAVADEAVAAEAVACTPLAALAPSSASASAFAAGAAKPSANAVSCKPPRLGMSARAESNNAR